MSDFCPTEKQIGYACHLMDATPSTRIDSRLRSITSAPCRYSGSPLGDYLKKNYDRITICKLIDHLKSK